MTRPTIFLDKDGTLIENVPYNVDPAHIRLTPGAAEALALLHTAGYQFVVISNQSGVARGHFPETALATVEGRLRELLAQEAGVPLTGFYYCPHHPEGIVPAYAIQCDCRKPAPGLLLKAAREQNIELEHAWFVGDILDDVEAGRRAGCKTILLLNGNETEWVLSPQRRPHYMIINFIKMVQLIQSVDTITLAGAIEPAWAKSGGIR